VKVLYLNTTGSLGGAEMCLLDVMAALRRSRPDWSLGLIVGEDGPLRHEAEALGVSCRVLPLPAALARVGDAGLKDRAGKPRGRLALALAAAPAAAPLALYVARLHRAIRQSRPDVVHTNGMKAHVLAAWASPRRLPMVWHLHDFIASRAVMGRLLRMVARPGITGVAVSRAVAEDAAKVFGAKVPVQTVYNAVDLARFAPEGPRVDLDAASGLPPAPEGTVRVGLIGTFATWKGQDVFLEAIAKIDANIAAQARFTIIGGPIYKTGGSQWTIEELRGRADRLGLGDRIGFAGFQPDPSAAIRGLDVVVHASTRPEPFGRVIVEGMACGKAVIAVNGGGSAELFEDNQTALGIPPDDPSALASAMTRLIADPELRARIAAAGRASAVARFDRNDLAGRWEAVYEAGGDGRP
jgi:glycosyltransferase involved in cell wall biosynthesis